MKTSSSLTDWWICTPVSRAENLETLHGVKGIPSLCAVEFENLNNLLELKT
jgi:hypothetical protein